MIVLLDSGPLGMICHHQTTQANQGCKAWFVGLINAGVHLGARLQCHHVSWDHLLIESVNHRLKLQDYSSDLPLLLANLRSALTLTKERCLKQHCC